MIFTRTAIAAALVVGCVDSGSAQDSSGQNDANNPLTPKVTLNVQDYYTPSTIGSPGTRPNQFLLRGLIPSDLFGAPQLMRFTLPIESVSSPQIGSDEGFGDLTLMDVFIVPGKEVSFGFGPILVAPTASSDLLGAGKWQAGAAAVIMVPKSWGIFGGLLTYQQSFAGDRDRADVESLTFEPLVTVNLPQGFYVRSSATWSFDLENDTFVIPVGLGIGKVWHLSKAATLNTYVEPQYSVFHQGTGIPRWQIFAGVNLQLALGK